MYAYTLIYSIPLLGLVFFSCTLGYRGRKVDGVFFFLVLF